MEERKHSKVQRSAGTEPIRTYRSDDTPSVLHNETLWHTCTHKVVGLYALMPFTTQTENMAAGRTAGDSRIAVSPAAFTYDPANDKHEDRLHAMEPMIERLLRRARQDSPSFWTLAHRYVASDSVWCE